MTPSLFALWLAAAAPAAPDRDWAAALRADAQALHDDVAANHPGPVNAADPGFGARNDRWLGEALARAARVKDYAGYLYAMRAYGAHFDDGHLAFYTDKGPDLAARWPGFLTAYEADGRQRVRARADDAPVSIGATLIGCDGQGADALAARNIGAFRGRWSLLSTRVGQGWRLFVDTGNPYVTRPARCTFRIDGRLRRVTLAWRPLPDAEYDRRVALLNRGPPEPIGARPFPDGTRWFTLSGFDGDPAGKDAAALVPLIAAMERDRDAIAAAPRIVLDLRGNNGGSSDWSRRIAAVLWGRAALDGLDKGRTTHVDWRVSPANLARLTAYREQFAQAADASPAIRRYFAGATAGMAAALARGQPLWREPDDLYHETPVTGVAASPVTPLRARVFFVTDTGCASACLDAADLWRSLGAVQVGQETSADTLYMDIREDPLPSGIAGVAVPMKVYRGRPRGANTPLRPVHAFAGNMRDTAALEAWVASLPEGGR